MKKNPGLEALMIHLAFMDRKMQWHILWNYLAFPSMIPTVCGGLISAPK
jgi:hypothetical protein